MFRNYVLIALRALRKNPIPASVNMLGLSLAIAAAITVYLFLERTYTMDRFHEDGEQIFVAHHVGIVRDLNALGVAGGARTDCLVRRVLDVAPGVARDHRLDALDALEDRLRTPETPARERRLLGHSDGWRRIRLSLRRRPDGSITNW